MKYSRRTFVASIYGTCLSIGPLSSICTAGVSEITIDCTHGWLYYANLTFPVVLPREQFRLPVTGTVIRTDYRPTWWPTPNTRAAYERRHGRTLPKAVPYGDPRNAMGEGRIVIDFDQSWMRRPPLMWIRIHGNADPVDLHQSLSRGCFRLLDKNILQLMNAIGTENPRVRMES